MKLKIFPLFILISNLVFSQASLNINLLPGEKVWSGFVDDGAKMPFDAGYHFDFYANNGYNQAQPLLLGNKGLWVWSEEPFAFEVQNDRIIISNATSEIKFAHAGSSLAEARAYASKNFFPASGKMPEKLLFSKPQYNTWIELTYNQNQADVLKYAKAILDNGFEPGVLMIDDTWQEDYGKWVFHPGRFPNPKQMIDQLHQMGFKVMVWVCPFVSADQAVIVRKIMKGKGFLMQKTADKPTWEKATDPAMIKWWNGYSALLDFTNPTAVSWFNEQLDALVTDLGVDGFKLDAGDMEFYSTDALPMIPSSPNRQCELYAQIGLRFPLNEYRACWKMAGQPLVQRLRDKSHNWTDVGNLIPLMLAEGLAGYTFSCPDMIGGGEYLSFQNAKTLNQNLVVRSAQIHALMPMMQFSVAPWRILDAVHLDAVKKAAKIRQKFTPLILELAAQSAKTGELIVSSMEYRFPNQGFEMVNDQFMLGENMLVAPVYQDGTSRTVVLPKGNWIDDAGKTYKGGKTYTLEVPLDRIPYFIRSK
ncbi:MAG: glycoside hydrolase family 31 protein [Prolixibacteraceae bacterium]|nr:glycoside hydrolase family 31 protein [Prolixibacteraceae bacterium]